MLSKVGRPKKQKPECKPKLVKKFRVTVNKQWRDFDYQDKAREHAIRALQGGGVTYLSIDDVEMEEEDC